MSYILFHYQIRNDYHCPSCRQPTVYVCESIEEACNKFKQFNIESERNLEILRNGEPIWIDEWERRRNGDLYQIVKIIPDITYIPNLNNLNEHDSILEKDQNMVKYMLLHIVVDPSEWCPYNIKYYMSFHETLELTQKEMMRKSSVNDCLDESNFDSIWINSEKGKGGNYFQIFDLDTNRKINLFESYKQLKTISFK
jgi:hypothetical protein